jgi:hypothetical protein
MDALEFYLHGPPGLLWNLLHFHLLAHIPSIGNHLPRGPVFDAAHVDNTFGYFLPIFSSSCHKTGEFLHTLLFQAVTSSWPQSIFIIHHFNEL